MKRNNTQKRRIYIIQSRHSICSTPSSDITANSNGIARQFTKRNAISIDAYENKKNHWRLYSECWNEHCFSLHRFFVFAFFFLSMLREDHITIISRLRGTNVKSDADQYGKCFVCTLYILQRCNEHSGAKQRFHQKGN